MMLRFKLKMLGAGAPVICWRFRAEGVVGKMRLFGFNYVRPNYPSRTIFSCESDCQSVRLPHTVNVREIAVRFVLKNLQIGIVGRLEVLFIECLEFRLEDS